MPDFLDEMRNQVDATKKKMDAALSELEAVQARFRETKFTDDAKRKAGMKAVDEKKQAWVALADQFNALATTLATMAGKKNY